MNGRKLSRITAAVLIVFGCTLLGGVAYEWWPCFSGYTPACANVSATNTTATALLASWVAALTTSLVGFSVALHKGRAFIGVAILLCLNPITDRGAVFIPWDTADIVPFTGGWIALATLTSGLTLTAGLRTKPANPHTGNYPPYTSDEARPPVGAALPIPSLIQQRMQLERALWRPWVWLGGGAMLTATNLTRLVTFSATPWWDFLGLAVGGGLVMVGLMRSRKARRVMHSFEREHGPDAGKQRSVS